MDLSRLDTTTPTEIDSFRHRERTVRGYVLPPYELWLSERPDVLKRWLYQIQQFSDLVPFVDGSPRIEAMASMQLYCYHGYSDGVVYEIDTCERAGHRRAEVVEALAVAFLHSPSRGMSAVAGAAEVRLRRYNDPRDGASVSYPPGWEVDPEAFSSGLDFSDPDLDASEYRLLQAWYMKYLGEIPGYVSFLFEFRPALLKGFRNRFENAIQSALPRQMMPYMMLHFETTRASEHGIREALLLARGFGMAREQAVDAIAWGMMYGGPAAISAAERAGRQLLRDWYS